MSKSVILIHYLYLHSFFVYLIVNVNLCLSLRFPTNYSTLIIEFSLITKSNVHQFRFQIATGTISQQQGLQDKGYEEWAGEMIGMREILRKFANISRSEIVGARAPFLKPGRNTQFKVQINSCYFGLSMLGNAHIILLNVLFILL